jgi:hypothetical protein
MLGGLDMIEDLKKFEFKNHGYIYMFHCKRCGIEKNWLLCSRDTKINKITVKRDYVIMCPLCKDGKIITKSLFKDYKEIADINTEFLVKKITPTEYIKKLNIYIKNKMALRSTDTIS